MGEIASALDEIEPLWAGLPAGGDDDQADFRDLRDNLASFRAAADKLYGAVQGADDAHAASLSRAIVAAGKALVPVNYTVAGEFEHDLALGAPTVPALRPHKPVVAMSDDELWGATHQLRRALNRVRAGVRAATRILDDASAASALSAD